MNFEWVLAVSLFAGIAHAETGIIRICRDPGTIGAMDRKSVVIPSGSHFEHASMLGPDGRVQYIIVTTAPTTIGPKPACAFVAAKLETNFVRKPLTSKTGQFRAQFSIAGLDIFAVAIQDFR
jgi:hypothetical protein